MCRCGETISSEIRSDSSSSISSSLPYPSSSNNHGEIPMIDSLDLEVPLFDGAGGSSCGSSGRRPLDSAGADPMNLRGRLRAPLAAHKRFSEHVQGDCLLKLSESSPIRPRQHFTTSYGPDVSFVRTRCLGTGQLTSSDSAAPDADGDGLLSAHALNVHLSPPRTPLRTRRSSPISRPSGNLLTTGEEPPKLPLYFANSTPTVDQDHRTTESDSTPPQRERRSGLRPSILNTPKREDFIPMSPSQNLDLADFIYLTPSPVRRTTLSSPFEEGSWVPLDDA